MQTTSVDNSSTSDPFSWEMIGLGLDEPLPNQDVIDELSVASSPTHAPQPLMLLRLGPKCISRSSTS